MKRGAALLRRLVRVDVNQRPDTLPTVPHFWRLRNGVRPSRLERPGIEPGAERCIRPSVDTIEAPQRLSITLRSVGGKPRDDVHANVAHLTHGNCVDVGIAVGGSSQRSGWVCSRGGVKNEAPHYCDASCVSMGPRA
jgi:hypothetical protein